MVRERSRIVAPRLAGLVGVALGLAVAPAFADLYRWVDARGVVNYSNVAPHAVQARRIAETEPTVSVIPPPERRPELQQSQREAALQRRIEQLEIELAELRRANAAVVAYPYPAPVPAVTYSAPVVYPYPVYSWPIRGTHGGHRFKPRHPGYGSRWRPGGRPPVAAPHGGRSGLTVRARF
jgi:hypothetical protein